MEKNRVNIFQNLKMLKNVEYIKTVETMKKKKNANNGTQN